MYGLSIIFIENLEAFMKAKVKNVKIGTNVKTERHHDEFVDGMVPGKTLRKVEPRCEEWYWGTTYQGDIYNYHESWLTFIEPKKK
jgi:hypothetical protein